MTCTCLNYSKMASRTVSFRACEGVAFGKTDCPYREEGEPPPTPTKIERPRIEPTKYLGDRIEAALSSVGVTKQVVEKFLGEPCGCAERQEKFNQLDKWARAVALGAVGNAKGFLEKIFRGETKMPTGN